MGKLTICLLMFILVLTFPSMGQDFGGVVIDPGKKTVPGVKIENLQTNEKTRSEIDGSFSIQANLNDSLEFTYPEFDTSYFVVTDLSSSVKIKLTYNYQLIEEATVERKRLEHFDVGILPPLKGVQITTGTNALISMEKLNGAKSTGNPREIYARIPGINIWESDGAGIQLGIGGRGLSPNRTANFNTRQNGYDIAADALGYPESYYTPATEALRSIEIVRGSASLQYGTQFGGLLNFVLREAPKNTPFEVTSRSTFGSYGYQGYFNRIAGTYKRFSYQLYSQVKLGDGYRANSSFLQNQVFAQLGYQINENQWVKLEYTHMDYLAQQAGGLSDVQFELDPRASFRDRNWFAVDWNVLALRYQAELGKTTINLRSFGLIGSRKALGFLGKINQADPLGARDLIAGTFQNYGTELRALRKYNLNENVKGAALIGARYYSGQTTAKQGLADSGTDANFRFNKPDNVEGSSYIFPSQNVSAFAENIFFLGSSWTFHAGIRQEYISSSSDGYYQLVNLHPLTGDTLSNQRISGQLESPRDRTLVGGGASYKLNKSLSFYGNFTQNYRAINFSDIRIKNPNIVVDTAIQDEFGHTIEGGFRGTWKKLWTYDVAVFTIFYGNKIGIAPQEGKIERIRTNIGDARNSGIELFSEFDFYQLFSDETDKQIRWFVNGAYIESAYIRSLEANFIGKSVEYVPPFIFRSGLKLVFGKLSTQLQYSYTDAQFADASNAIEPSGDATVGLVPSYAVADFNIQYKHSNMWQIEAGVNNIANAQFFTRRATAYPGPGILPADGRNFYATLRFYFAAKRK